jgi:hypothetical protein
MPTHQLCLSRVCKQTLQRSNYRKTPHSLYGILVLISLSALFLSFALLRLYHGWLQTGQERRSLNSSPWYKIQSLIQACILCTFSPNGQITFFAATVLSGTLLPSWRMSLKIHNIFVKLLSDNPLSALNLNSSSVGANFEWPFLQFGYNCSFESSSKVWISLYSFESLSSPLKMRQHRM